MAILLRPTLENAERLPKLYKEERQQATRMQRASSLSCKVEVANSILSIYNIILTDTRNFLKELLDQIAILVCTTTFHVQDSD